jgi:hypothetical protein
MQFERLVIEAGPNTFTVDFHERLTVIAGLGRLEREGLVNELIGALSSSRSGDHLEMVSDAGNRFAIFRPEGARHRVVDIDSAQDVTARFRSSSGGIDLLGRAGLDVAAAKKRMRITASDLTTASETDRYISTLARVDQGRLWELVDKVLDRERRLNEVAEEAGSAPEDAEVMAKIEQRHREFEEAQARHEQVRSITLYGSFLSIVAAIPAAMFTNAFVVIPFIAAAVAAAIVSVIFYRQLEQARDAEQEALSEAGAQSYLTFHLQRVNGLLSSDHSRRQLMKASEEHRAALAEWRLIAGEATVEFAIAHRSEIRRAARAGSADLRVGVVAPSTPSPGTAANDLAETMITRLSNAKRLGPGGESFPVILDDPLTEIDVSDKPALLELVARSSRQQQIIFLTNDDTVTSWARVEAIGGELSIIEPTADRGGPTSHPRRSRRHVAA